MPTLVTGLQGKQVVHVAAGNHHTICTTADGSVSTWGGGGDGKLGLGDDRSNKLVPTQNKAVVQVAVGDNHSLCMVGDGLVYSWGSNNQGQPGVVDISNASLPVLVQQCTQYAVQCNKDTLDKQTM